MKNIAVQGCVLDCAFAQITSLPDSKSKVDGLGIYCGSINIQISGYSSSVITVSGSGTGSGTLQPTSNHVKIGGKAVVLEGDEVTITVNGQATSGTSTVPMSELVTVKITNAGQNVVKGE